MSLAVTSPPSTNVHDPPKGGKRWWRVLGHTLSTFSMHTEPLRTDSRFIPLPLKSPISYMCNDNAPTETGRMLKPAGETSTQYTTEALSSIDGPPIPPHQSPITFGNLAVAGRYQGSNPPWTYSRTQLLRCPSHLVPEELERVSQPFIRADLVRAGTGSKAYSSPQLLPQVKCDDTNFIARNGGYCPKFISGDPPSNGINVSAIDPSSSPLDNDTHVADTSMAEFVPIIRSFIHSQSSVTAARSLRGEAAQELIDIIDHVTAIQELDEKLRKQCLHLLYKMCKGCKTLPTSYIMQPGSLSVGDVHYNGGFAYVGTGDYLKRRVAIKHLKFWTKDGPDGVFKRFCQEIIVWKRLSHPNVLPLLGVSFSTDPYSFLMSSAWMENGNVMEYTRSNPGANRLQLLSGAASGVSYLHGLGVIHGDLKGANILVDDHGTALLADFGLATVSVDLHTIPLSATAVSAAGTIPWTSPEVLFGKSSPTRESDSYALGMVVYEVLTGHSPFHDLPGYTVLIAVQKGERPRRPISARSLGFSYRLWRLVVRCWDESPSTRPTAQDLLRSLQDISPTWTPPLKYPIPDGPDVEASPDSISRGEQITAIDAPTSSFFVPIAIMLCAFVLSFQ